MNEFKEPELPVLSVVLEHLFVSVAVLSLLQIESCFHFLAAS